MLPVKLNPITVLLPDDIVKPASAAAPPPAPTTIAPSTSNWNPAIGVSLLNKISALSALNAPNAIVAASG